MLDHFFENYADYEFLLASVQLFLAMFGMGLLLTVQDFVLEIKNPKGMLVGLSFQWLFVPLVALILSTVLPIPTGIAIGILVAAAVPGGTLSNILTHFGKGNIALSISLTSITTVASIVTTPLLLHLMIASYLPADFEMPTALLAQGILLNLILPLSIGMVLKAKVRKATSESLSKWVIRFCLLIIVVMAVGAGGSGRLDPQAYGLTGILALASFGFALQFSAFLVTKFAGLSNPDILAVVIEVTLRNMGLAIAIKAIIFPAVTGQLDPIGDAVLFSALLYGAVGLFLSLVPMAVNRIGSTVSAVTRSPEST